MAADELDAEMARYYAARAGEYDEWYLRQGRHSHGPASDAAWDADLAAAREWLAALPMSGRIADLAAGTAWWSPVLAEKGRLALYDASAETLEIAKARLERLGIEATYDVRDVWAEPDCQVDAVFTGFWLSHVSRRRLGEFMKLVGRWLRPGGCYAFIDSRRDPESGAIDHEPPDGEVHVRRLDDGSTFRVRKIYYSPAELTAALEKAGFASVDVRETDRFFLLGSARR
jgi:SAM-dependent methyltransferase